MSNDFCVGFRKSKHTLQRKGFTDIAAQEQFVAFP